MKKYKPVVEDHTGRFPHTLSQSDLVGVINEDRRQDFNRIIGYVDSQKFITPVVFETKIKDIDARIDEKFNDNINKIREKINGFDKKLADSIEINDKTHEELKNVVKSITIPEPKLDTTHLVTKEEHNRSIQTLVEEINKVMDILRKERFNKAEREELGRKLQSGIKGVEYKETLARLNELKADTPLTKEATI